MAEIIAPRGWSHPSVQRHNEIRSRAINIEKQKNILDYIFGDLIDQQVKSLRKLYGQNF